MLYGGQIWGQAALNLRLGLIVVRKRQICVITGCSSHIFILGVVKNHMLHCSGAGTPRGAGMNTHRGELCSHVEIEYSDYFAPFDRSEDVYPDGESLEQPSPLQVVPTVTTYGTIAQTKDS